MSSNKNKPTKNHSKRTNSKGGSLRNTKSVAAFIQKRKTISPDQIFEKLIKGDRVALAKAITIIESARPEDQEFAQNLISKSLKKVKKSFRIGITGPPGVGKSTFIESIGKHILKDRKKLAILTIDPTSQVSKGSVLGDKTRMQDLSSNKKVFIRPSAAGATLGGVARKTRETITLCEAAGYDTIIVETVGVGQSEIAVHSMVDVFCLLLMPGGGDELQGIKRGVVEMADLIAINKADEDRIGLAKKSRAAFKNAIHLYPPNENGWETKVMTCSGLNDIGVDAIWTELQNYYDQNTKTGFLKKRRTSQSRFWLHETILNNLKDSFYQNPKVKAALLDLEKNVIDGKLSPFQAAEKLIKLIQDN